jgi:hypothetical protein
MIEPPLIPEILLVSEFITPEYLDPFTELPLEDINDDM